MRIAETDGWRIAETAGGISFTSISVMMAVPLVMASSDSKDSVVVAEVATKLNSRSSHKGLFWAQLLGSDIEKSSVVESAVTRKSLTGSPPEKSPVNAKVN